MSDLAVEANHLTLWDAGALTSKWISFLGPRKEATTSSVRRNLPGWVDDDDEQWRQKSIA